VVSGWLEEDMLLCGPGQQKGGNMQVPKLRLLLPCWWDGSTAMGGRRPTCGAIDDPAFNFFDIWKAFMDGGKHTITGR